MFMFIIVAVVIATVALYVMGTYNRLTINRERVNNSKSQIAVQIESRWDALSNLITATQQYATHEKETFESIVAGRKHVTGNSDIQDFEDSEEKYRGGLNRLLAITENYPELRASDLYKETMGSINEYEKNVRLSRMTYNDTVTRYNQSILLFPQSVIAGWAGFNKEEYFEGTDSKQDMPTW